MNKTASAIILIILGLIVMAFPLLGYGTAAVISGVIVLIVGLGLIFAGIMVMGESATMGILELILGIILAALGIGFLVSPGLFAAVAGFLVWIVGLFLVIAGIIGVISKTGGSRWNGVIAIIIGLLYMAVGSIVSDPIYFGILIGLWLLITGILMLFQKE